MATKKLNVQSFPRPPLLEKLSRHIQIKWMGSVIVDTKDAYWVLETHHPPTYYLPPDSVKVKLRGTPRKTFCEVISPGGGFNVASVLWKGSATYYAITSPGDSAETVSNRIWSYDNPTGGFEPIRGYLSFYAGPWDCFVDGEKVEPQPGDFYGGWVTSEIEGIVKGRHGNFDPVV